MDREAAVGALEELALLAELAGENPFKVRAYAAGARALAACGVPLDSLLAPGALEAIPGVGKGIASLVREGVATGKMTALESLRASVPEGVRALLAVPGLGPKKVLSLWKTLGVASLGELEYACVENRLAALYGFGPKIQAKVLEGVRFCAKQAGRSLLPEALGARRAIEGRLAGGGFGTWFWTGEAGRLCETVGGLELLAPAPDAVRMAESLGLSPSGQEFVGSSPEGLRILLRGCDARALGASAVWYGSSEPFRDALRARLRDGGVDWGPAGLIRAGGRIDTPSEPAFWEACGRAAVPPECREFPRALDADIGELLSESDVRGAFHVHTDWSDGSASLRAMVEAAAAMGWAWVGICDHSASATYAGGLSEGRLREQVRAIRDLRASHPEIRAFAGVESDILADGGLDYGSEVLAEVDLVVASVHSRFGLDEDAQTARLVRALENPATTLLGHPTGRLLLAREAYAHRWDDVVEAARGAGASVELNANPRRLDVDWRRLPDLADAGVSVAVNPDAHSVAGLADLGWGVVSARKGLLRRGQVWNTLGASEVEERLRAMRAG